MRLHFALAALVCLALVPAAAAQKRVDIEVGSPAPGLDVEEWLFGESVAIKEGNVYVILFFGTDCLDCRTLFPVLNEIHELNFTRDVEVVAISGEDKSDVQRFINGIGTDIDFSVGVDRRNSTMRAWRVSSKVRGSVSVGYIVGKRSKVQFIGVPGTLEFMRILELVVEGRYDAKLFEKARPMNKAAKNARKVRNWRLAHRMIDEVISLDPDVFAFKSLEKFEMKLIDEHEVEAAYAYAEKLLKDYGDDAWLMSQLAEKIATDPMIADEDRRLDVAMQAAKAAARLYSPQEPERYALPAMVHFRAHRVNEAVKLQKRAYFMARPLVKAYYKRVLREYQSVQRRETAGAKKK